MLEPMDVMQLASRLVILSGLAFVVIGFGLAVCRLVREGG